MKRNKLAVQALVLAALSAAPVCAGADWTDFRGGASFASSGEAGPPTDWSLEEGRNVAWAADLPGRGVSGPIVVGERVFVTASDGPDRERLHVAAYDTQDGKRLWRRQMWATGRTLIHPTSAVAAPTPATDGRRVFAFYSSNDLICYDLNGALQWFRPLALDHPGIGNDVGMASSPVVAGDVVVVQAESQRVSFVLACDRRTGETVWEVERPKSSNWASPLPIETDAGPAVVVQGSEGVVAYSASDGEVLWRLEIPCGGIPSLCGDGRRLVLPGDSLTAVSIAGDAPETLWKADKMKAGSPSPVLWQDRVMVVNRAGVLTCGDLATGDIVWRRRLGGSFWATPVVADGRAYCVNSAGKAFVVDVAGDGEILAEPDFGIDVLATPAVSGDALYVRAYERLWKIAAPRLTSQPRANGARPRR